MSARTSWRSRRIDGRALTRLDVLGQGRLVLQLPPWATVTRDQVRPLEADLLARRYQLTGDPDVDWRIPASALARSLLLLLALAVVPFAVLRAYAGAVLRRKLDDVDKAHRLQGALLAAALLLPALLLVAVNLTTAFGRAPAVSPVALLLSWLLLLAGAPPLAVRPMPTRPLEEPTRGRLEELLRRGGVRVRGIACDAGRPASSPRVDVEVAAGERRRPPAQRRASPGGRGAVGVPSLAGAGTGEPGAGGDHRAGAGRGQERPQLPAAPVDHHHLPGQRLPGGA